MPKAERTEIVAAAIKAGVNKHTASKQVYLWAKQRNGKKK